MNRRIVHYYPRASVGDGGCSSAVRGWASAVAQTGAQVSVVCDDMGDIPPSGQVCWLATAHRRRGRFRCPVGLERVLSRGDVLILHSGWVYYNVHAARVAAASGVPYVLTPHGAYDPNVFRRTRPAKRIWWALFERRLVRQACAIHVFFEEQRQQLRQLGYTGPVIIAPNGLAAPPFEPRPAGSTDLLWMGRFDIETKGIDLLLCALASLPPAMRPSTRLHGPDWRGGRQRVADLIRQLHLEGVVTIGDPLYGAEKWKALRDCALFVFPSRWEGQGLMALEAAAAAAPLVVTSTTAVGRHLAAADAAILVEPTPESIAAGILTGCSAPARELGARASAFVRKQFSWPSVAESYAQQLQAVL
jgi:glycosyltransferase involved in cell wall biosynthesis